MYLHEIERGSKIVCEVSDGSQYVIFNKPDGMYSHCTTEKGGTVHLGLMTELEPYTGVNPKLKGMYHLVSKNK